MDLVSHGLAADDALRALTFAISSAARGDQQVMSIKTLEDGYRSMVNHAAERITAMREVLEKGQFDVAYQPIVDLTDGAVHHYEALARFDKDAKSASPFEMITFAEEVGLIGDFDLAMLERVAENIEAHMARGVAPHVAVNLSGKSLADPDFVDALQGVLSRHQSTKPQILFEITESHEIADLQTINERIQRLRKDGHRVCLDDFGAGAAAFHYLRILEVDLVKIDGLYVRDAIKDAQTQSFLKAMVALCADLGIDTAAEMIEDRETAEFLRKSGVRYGQGYYFGRPKIGLGLSGDAAPAATVSEPKTEPAPKDEAPQPPRQRMARVRRRRGAQTTWG
jgi:EAL domain-containing protein (putative c-di-GMP-specific phosphodiesterase class I)